MYRVNSDNIVFSVTWMNRIQNESIISECNESEQTWDCVTRFTQAQEKGWIEIAPAPTYNGDSFIQILPSMQESNGLHYKHIARLDKGSNCKKHFPKLLVNHLIISSCLSNQRQFCGD